MTVCLNEGNWDTSNVEFAGGAILRYSKTNRTPRMLHIDYGLGAFRREAFDVVPDDRPFGLDALYELLLERGELAALEVPGRFYEIGSTRGIEDLSEYLSRQIA
jgi:NDP-sugar pyrophosphorylase family protein